MFYGNKLYPSARHLLLANPALVAGGDLGKVVTSLNDKARRAKNRGDVRNLSLLSMIWRKLGLLMSLMVLLPN
jgi:hypothetical protein